MEWRTNLEPIDEKPEVQKPNITTFIHERVDVFLQKEVLDNTALCHQAEQIEVAAEKDMQAHLQEITAGRTTAFIARTLCTICPAAYIENSIGRVLLVMVLLSVPMLSKYFALIESQVLCSTVAVVL